MNARLGLIATSAMLMAAAPAGVVANPGAAEAGVIEQQIAALNTEVRRLQAQIDALASQVSATSAAITTSAEPAALPAPPYQHIIGRAMCVHGAHPGALQITQPIGSKRQAHFLLVV